MISVEFMKKICQRLKILKGGAARCQENAKFVEKVKFQETMYLIPTDTHEENGMLIFRRLKLMIMELLEEQKYVLDVLNPTE